MARLSVCVEMLWSHLPFEERIQRAAKAGVQAIEFWDYSKEESGAIAAATRAAGVQVAAFVCEPGFALTGPTPVAEHVTGVRRAAAVGRELGCATLIVTAGNVVAGETSEATRRRVLRKLTAMAVAAAEENVTLVLEPLNPFIDHPGYWLTEMAQAADLVEEVGNEHLMILYDIYHQQLTEGKIIVNLRRYAPLIGHIHVAATPGRTNLVGGDLDYRAIFGAIDQVGYTGYVGLELRPSGTPEEAVAEALSLLP
jgi:hydroxypyruvate isomerase